MPVPGVAFRLLDGSEAAARENDLLALRDEVYGPDADAGFARQFRVWRRQPGFVLAEARHGGYLVGFACGLPLRPSTSWWRDLTTPLPAEVTTEHPGRTFALTELLVRASWRRQGIGRALHDLILDPADRPEERATLTVPPGAGPAQHAFRKWNWRRVARTRGATPEVPVLDLLVKDLQSRHRDALPASAPCSRPRDRAAASARWWRGVRPAGTPAAIGRTGERASITTDPPPEADGVISQSRSGTRQMAG